jgi:adenylate kinase family enzyme
VSSPKILDTDLCLGCDKIGVRREDDNTLNAIQNRIKVYRKSIEDIKKYFKSIDCKIIEYDANSNRNILHNKILQDLLIFFKN